MTSHLRLPGAAAILLIAIAACGPAATAAPTAAPTTATTVAPATDTPTEAPTEAAASMDPRIANFCTAFTTDLATRWPPTSQVAAVALGPVFADYAQNAGLSAIAADLLLVDEWTQLAARGMTTEPSQPVLDAFARISDFVVANC